MMNDLNNKRGFRTPYLDEELHELQNLTELENTAFVSAESPYLNYEFSIEEGLTQEWKETELEEALIENSISEQEVVLDYHQFNYDDAVEQGDEDNEFGGSYELFERNPGHAMELEYDAEIDVEIDDEDVNPNKNDENDEVGNQEFRDTNMLAESSYGSAIMNRELEKDESWAGYELDGEDLTFEKEAVLNRYDRDMQITDDLGEEELDLSMFEPRLEEPEILFEDEEKGYVVSKPLEYSKNGDNIYPKRELSIPSSEISGVIPLAQNFLAFVEKQVSSTLKCKDYPNRFHLLNWPKRWKKIGGSKRNIFFTYLEEKKKLKLAVLARGKVSVETKKLMTIIKTLVAPTTISEAEFVKILQKVNVTVELIRVLKPNNFEEVLRQHIEYYHEKYLSACVFGKAVFSNLIEKKHNRKWVEDTLGISLDKAYKVTGIHRLSDQEKKHTILVTFLSMPREILDYLIFKTRLRPNANQPKRFPNSVFRSDLNAVRYGSSYVHVSPKFVEKRIRESRNRPGSWTRRIPNFKLFLRSIRTVGIGVDLFKIDLPKDIDVNRYLTKEFDAYLYKNEFDPFLSFTYPVKDQRSVENIFHVDLSELVKNIPSTASKDNFLLLVYIGFPRTILRSGHVVSTQREVLDHFKTESAVLTKKHVKRLSYLARYIVESFWNADNHISWKKYRPVTKINLIGAGDARGSEAYNKALGHKRSKSAERFLKRKIDFFWRSLPGNTGSLASKIQFNSDSIGNEEARNEHGKKDNPYWRAVEIRLHHQQDGIKRIIQIIDETLDLLKHFPNIVQKVMREDEADVVKCILKKLKNPLADDRIAKFPSGDTKSDKLLPGDFLSARYILFSKYVFRPPSSTEDKLKHALEVHRVIKWNNKELAKRSDKDSSAVDNKIKYLMIWIEKQEDNNNSIYSCYD